MNNIYYLRPEYEDTGDDCFDHLLKVEKQITPSSQPVKKEFNYAQEDLFLDLAREITMLGAEFISFGNRMNTFAARLLDITETDNA